MPASRSQSHAWESSLTALKLALKQLKVRKPDSSHWGLVLEYELPRERGRRPDAVLLAPGRIVVIEFKESRVPLPEFLDQVEAYARDLAEYHAASHDLKVIPVLVVGGSDRFERGRKVIVANHEELAEVLDDILDLSIGDVPDLEAWIHADYRPLPSLVTAARTIFEHKPLPAIRRAESAGIPAALDALTGAANAAETRGERHLAFVTGVPGAGKTLVGLQFVYQTRGDDDTSKQAVFLSGNGPLVGVLQHALENKIFVQDVHGFLRQYGGNRTRTPQECIWVYDEAQRAWDSERAAAKRDGGLSEPEDFLRLGARMDHWALVVGLIGEGQEIHLGEEAGIGQWNDAMRASGTPWHIHCPSRLAGVFPAATSIAHDDALDLTVSLRSHRATEVQDWVRDLLLGRLDQANSAAIRAQQVGYTMYITDNLDRAKAYVRTRYADAPDARFGLIASSKDKSLPAFGIDNGYYGALKPYEAGPWFNDEPTSIHSCRQLRKTATEFQCQGLELDYPIVCWGDDLWWDHTAWVSKPSPRSQARDPHSLRVNSYRVLLSRGRDGMVVFCPPNIPIETRDALLRSGLVNLPL